MSGAVGRDDSRRARTREQHSETVLIYLRQELIASWEVMMMYKLDHFLIQVLQEVVPKSPPLY